MGHEATAPFSTSLRRSDARDFPLPLAGGRHSLDERELRSILVPSKRIALLTYLAVAIPRVRRFIPCPL